MAALSGILFRVGMIVGLALMSACLFSERGKKCSNENDCGNANYYCKKDDGDNGVCDRQANKPDTDSLVGDRDAGTPMADAGTPDSGTVVLPDGGDNDGDGDAGSPIGDAGSPATDAGDGDGDAGGNDSGTVVTPDGVIDCADFDAGTECTYLTTEFLSDDGTKLQWQLCRGGQLGLDCNLDVDTNTVSGLDYGAAHTYCDQLLFNEFFDWRLPSIDELRTLIDGCPDTNYGGQCEITSEGLNGGSPDNSNCNGCSENSGPNDGGYLISDLPYQPSNNNNFWSSSYDSVVGKYATVDFAKARVFRADLTSIQAVRCVRDWCDVDTDCDIDWTCINHMCMELCIGGNCPAHKDCVTLDGGTMVCLEPETATGGDAGSADAGGDAGTADAGGDGG
jgi:hypothetical protein